MMMELFHWIKENGWQSSVLVFLGAVLGWLGDLWKGMILQNRAEHFRREARVQELKEEKKRETERLLREEQKEKEEENKRLQVNDRQKKIIQFCQAHSDADQFYGTFIRAGAIIKAIFNPGRVSDSLVIESHIVKIDLEELEEKKIIRITHKNNVNWNFIFQDYE